MLGVQGGRTAFDAAKSAGHAALAAELRRRLHPSRRHPPPAAVDIPAAEVAVELARADAAMAALLLELDIEKQAAAGGSSSKGCGSNRKGRGRGGRG